METRRWCFAVLCIASVSSAHAGELAVRDALTGAPLQAIVRPLDDAAPAFVADGQLRQYPAVTMPGRVRVEAAAHRPVDIALGDGDAPTTILLDPLGEPDAYERLARRAALAPQARWLQGFTRDAVDGHALAGVDIAIEGRHARSDENGYFEVELDAVAADAKATDTTMLRAYADDHAELERRGIARIAGVQRLLLAFGGDTAARWNSVRATVRTASATGWSTARCP